MAAWRKINLMSRAKRSRMRPSDESVHRFMRLYTEFFGEELTINDARAMASRILFLYEHLARPFPGEEDIITEQSQAQVDDPPSSPQGDESFGLSLETPGRG